jgi:hypothetical protein
VWSGHMILWTAFGTLCGAAIWYCGLHLVHCVERPYDTVDCIWYIVWSGHMILWTAFGTLCGAAIWYCGLHLVHCVERPYDTVDCIWCKRASILKEIGLDEKTAIVVCLHGILQYFGHIARREPESLEKLVTGTVEGRRPWSRRHNRWLNQEHLNTG